MDVAGKRVLVVEDEPFVALGLEDNLRSLGCAVVGPAMTLAAALLAAGHESVDAAILDVNLGGETVFPAAAVLADRGIPFVFCSGFSTGTRLPERFNEVPRVRKPYTGHIIAQALLDLLGPDADRRSAADGALMEARTPV